MKPTPLPPPSILFACAVWFLHGFAAAALRTWNMLFRDARPDALIDGCILVFVLPLTAGSLLVLLRICDCRILLTLHSTFLIIVEIGVAVLLSTVGHREQSETVVWLTMLLPVSVVLQIIAIVLSLDGHWDYRAWCEAKRNEDE